MKSMHYIIQKMAGIQDHFPQTPQNRSDIGYNKQFDRATCMH